jgi:hypothetical protein
MPNRILRQIHTLLQTAACPSFTSATKRIRNEEAQGLNPLSTNALARPQFQPNVHQIPQHAWPSESNLSPSSAQLAVRGPDSRSVPLLGTSCPLNKINSQFVQLTLLVSYKRCSLNLVRFGTKSALVCICSTPYVPTGGGTCARTLFHFACWE